MMGNNNYETLKEDNYGRFICAVMSEINTSEKIRKFKRYFSGNNNITDENVDNNCALVCFPIGIDEAIDTIINKSKQNNEEINSHCVVEEFIQLLTNCEINYTVVSRYMESLIVSNQTRPTESGYNDIMKKTDKFISIYGEFISNNNIKIIKSNINNLIMNTATIQFESVGEKYAFILRNVIDDEYSKKLLDITNVNKIFSDARYDDIVYNLKAMKPKPDDEQLDELTNRLKELTL